jgi:chloramphenicol-sensitive protein RarD
MQFLVAVFVIGEAMSPDRWMAIGCVWLAVAIFVADALVQVRGKRRLRLPSVTGHAIVRTR